VEYKKLSNEDNYGFIKKIFHLNDQVFILIQKLLRSTSKPLIESLEIMKNHKYDKLISEKLNCFYVVTKLMDEFELINSKCLVTKCILIEDNKLFKLSPCVNRIHS
jgi:hypothetical protein